MLICTQWPQLLLGESFRYLEVHTIGYLWWVRESLWISQGASTDRWCSQKEPISHLLDLQYRPTSHRALYQQLSQLYWPPFGPILRWSTSFLLLVWRTKGRQLLQVTALATKLDYFRVCSMPLAKIIHYQFSPFSLTHHWIQGPHSQAIASNFQPMHSRLELLLTYLL